MIRRSDRVRPAEGKKSDPMLFFCVYSTFAARITGTQRPIRERIQRVKNNTSEHSMQRIPGFPPLDWSTGKTDAANGMLRINQWLTSIYGKEGIVQN